MFFIRDAYANVWKTSDETTYVKGNISTSEKKQDGTREYSNWFARFVGNAREKALTLSEKDNIKIITGKVTNVLWGTGENKKSYLGVVIFDFELLPPYEGNTNQNKTTSNSSNSDDDDQLPF